MKKAMVFTFLLGGLTSASLQASQEGSIVPQPLMRLPGVSAPHTASFSETLPGAIITDVTNAPNPFDSRRGGLAGETEISYNLTDNYAVSIEMYDLFGERVRSWNFKAGDNGGRAGLNTILWDGTNAQGQKVSKGGYIADIQIDTPQTSVSVIRKIGVIH